MTIQVTVKNADTRESAVIKIETINRGPGAPEGAQPSGELKGGESGSYFVHGTQDLRITELSQ